MKRLVTLLSLTLAIASAKATETAEPTRLAAPEWTWSPALSWQYDRVGAGNGPSQRHHGFRRQRVGFDLGGPRGLGLKLDYDLASGRWADALLRLPTGVGSELRIGQFKPPFGLEVLTSHRALSWLERSPAAALVPGRRLGLIWQKDTADRHLALAINGPDLDHQFDSRAVTVRFARVWTGASPHADRLHFGLAGGREWPRDPVRLRPSPGVTGLPTSWLPTPAIDGIERLDRTGLEGAWDRGPWHAQGEWLHLRGSGSSTDLSARGHYLSLGWRPGGQARTFKRGLPERMQPDRAWGALELVARVGRVDIDAQGHPPRHGRTATVGVNWIIDRRWSLHGQIGSARSSSGAELEPAHALRLHYQY